MAVFAKIDDELVAVLWKNQCAEGDADDAVVAAGAMQTLARAAAAAFGSPMLLEFQIDEALLAG